MDDPYRLVYSNDPARKKTATPSSHGNKAVIRLERKGRAGKVVTVIERLHLSDDELKQLLKECQKACGTGGTVKDHRIELQGDRQAALKAVLVRKGYKTN